MIRLYSSFYLEKNKDRHAELMACLEKNANNDSIDEINLMIEDIEESPVCHKKIKTQKLNRRPEYSDYFLLISESPRLTSDIAIVSNSDIYLDNNIMALSRALKPNQCAVLSRWDITPSGGPILFDRNDSQDVWIFRGLLKKIDGNFPIGVPRCDNRMLYELQKAGYEVINPAFSIRAYHLHSGIRQEYSVQNLEHFVDPPYAYLWPHNLWSLPRTILYNLRHPNARVSWRFDRRKFAASLPVRAVKKAWNMMKKHGAERKGQSVE